MVLWDPIKSREHTALSANLDGLGDLDFSPDGATLATANHDRSIELWDVASGSIKATLVSNPDAFCAFRFSPDGRSLASGSSAGVVRLWDVSSGKCRLALGATSNPAVSKVLPFHRTARNSCPSACCTDLTSGTSPAASKNRGTGARPLLLDR